MQLLLVPVVRYCLRNAHSIQDLINSAKHVFVQVAEQEILRTGKKANVSRISVMTGMYRVDVAKLHREKQQLSEEAVDVFGRVIGQWRNNKQYINKAGEPRILDTEEFREMVASVSKDINPGTVLFELRRLGLVEDTPKGIKHRKVLYNLGGDVMRVFQLLSTETDAHIKAVEENVIHQVEQQNLHLVTEYDNIFVQDLPKIRKWLMEQGKAFHKRARNFISKFDKDINPISRDNKATASGRVHLSAFSYTSEEGK